MENVRSNGRIIIIIIYMNMNMRYDVAVIEW